MSRSSAALILACAVLAAPSVSAAVPLPAPGTCSPQPISGKPVVVTTPTTSLTLRVARDPETREYGLMCVLTLAPRTGMIFVFAGPDRPQQFWMKNTLIPLDMVWVGHDGRVNDVAANVPATTVETPDEKIPQRSGTGSFVIELGAGDAAREGIKPGVHLDVSHVGTARS